MRKAIGVSWPARDDLSRYERFVGGLRLGKGAHAQVLLTLDRADFRDLLGGSFYGVTVLLPSDFLERERSRGRLK